jgi:hypothetical protein
LFRFVVNERYGAGYIDRQGRVVIQPQYLAFGNHGGDFFGGLAKVTAKDGDFYIDATGKRVARFDQFGAADYIDPAGKLFIPPNSKPASDFSEGLAPVEVDGRFGYIDPSGHFVIPPRFMSADEFADGHALVVENGPCQLIGYGPCDGLMPPNSTTASLHRCQYSVIDHSGNVVFAGAYIDAKHFSEGVAPMGDGKKWGYVDYSGKALVPIQFDDAEPFSEGLAAVRVGRNIDLGELGKVGFIDRTGAMIIQPQFLSAQEFSEGFAVVMDENRKYSFIDRMGRRRFGRNFDAASGFVMGLAHVRSGRNYYSARWSYIDRTGKAIFTYSDQSKRRRSIQ